MQEKTWNETTIDIVDMFVSCSKRIESLIKLRAPFEIVTREIEEVERRLQNLKATISEERNEVT